MPRPDPEPPATTPTTWGPSRTRPRRRPRAGRPIDPASLFVILDGLRRAAPRELEQQATNLVREFLLTLRSLIDWYLERLDHPDPEPRVEDIPID